MKRLRLLFVIILTILLASCTIKEKSLADQYHGKTAQQMFHRAETKLAKGSYKDASSEFEALDTLYPFSSYEQQAQLDIIYAYYGSQEYASAAAAAARYIHLYPRSPHVDYAYFMKGMGHFMQNRGFSGKYFSVDFSQRDLSSLKQAYNDFSDLVRRFPESRYIPNARARMVYLRNMLANHELNIARFYFTHDAYVATINRCDNILQHYQQSPAVIQALGMMVHSYDKLKLHKLANKTLTVLAYNFPKSDVYQQVLKDRAKERAQQKV